MQQLVWSWTGVREIETSIIVSHHERCRDLKLWRWRWSLMYRNIYIYIYVWSFMNHTTLLFYASIRHIIIRIKTILSVFYTENKAFIWVVIHGLRRGGGDRAGCLVCYRYLRVRWQDEKCLIRFQINIEWCTLVIYRLFLYLELYLCILRYLRILD